VIFEGALRKWVLPAWLHPGAFFAKDVVGICYIASRSNYARNRYQNRLTLLGYSTAGLLFIGFVLGLSSSWQSAIVTYKNAVLWPLIAGCVIATTTNETWRFLSVLIAPTTIAMFVLGFKQFLNPPSSWLNQYAWTAAGLQSPVATFGGIQGVRATGTFSYISGMSEFSVFSFVLCLYYLLNSFTLKERFLLIVGCLAAIGCAVESGSRAPIVLMAFVAATTSVMSLRSARKTVYIGMFLVAVTALMLFLPDNKMTREYLKRWTVDPQETLRRFTNEGLRGNYLEMLIINPIGIGLGQGNGYAIFETSRTNQLLATNIYDDGASIAIYEGGLLGLLAFYLAPCVLSAQLALGLTSRVLALRLLAGTFGLVSVLGLIAGVWHDHNSAAFTWLQIGIWFGLAKGFVGTRRGRTGGLEELLIRKPGRIRMV